MTLLAVGRHHRLGTFGPPVRPMLERWLRALVWLSFAVFVANAVMWIANGGLFPGRRR